MFTGFKQIFVFAVTSFIGLSALFVGFDHFSKYLPSNKPKLAFFDWIWPHQRDEPESSLETNYCGHRFTHCDLLGPRFLVGTFEASGHYVSHLSVQGTPNFEKPIGLVWLIV